MIYYQEHILNSLFESERTKAFPEQFKEFLKKSDNIDKLIQILDKEYQASDSTITYNKLKELWDQPIESNPEETLGNAAISIKKIYDVVTNKNNNEEQKGRIKNVLGENFFEKTKDIEDLKTAIGPDNQIKQIDDKLANNVYQTIKSVYQKIKGKIPSN